MGWRFDGFKAPLAPSVKDGVGCVASSGAHGTAQLVAGLCGSQSFGFEFAIEAELRAYLPASTCCIADFPYSARQFELMPPMAKRRNLHIAD